jgi:uncharacterized Zn-finger protein
MKTNTMYCTVCENPCFHNFYPHVGFNTIDENGVIVCENCSVDYEMRKGQIRFRQDLVDKGIKGYEPWIDNNEE